MPTPPRSDSRVHRAEYSHTFSCRHSLLVWYSVHAATFHKSLMGQVASLVDYVFKSTGLSIEFTWQLSQSADHAVTPCQWSMNNRFCSGLSHKGRRIVPSVGFECTSHRSGIQKCPTFNTQSFGCRHTCSTGTCNSCDISSDTGSC
ncbi:hypothetical protein SMG44B_20350 [Stenotrophomonas maltophilia]